jgi:hypothetical protein
MELKTFVTETLAQIVEGVSEAQKRIAEMDVGAAVNPGAVDSASARKIGKASPVDFDVAVLISEESAEQTGSAAKASLGLISVVSARTAAELESRSSGGQRNETTSRIKFSVQLAQPADLATYTIPRNPAGNWKTA